MNQLQKLCRPLFIMLSDFCGYSGERGGETAKSLQDKIRREFDSIRANCEDDTVLKREFSKIEKPLVFFIDYIVKEGGTPIAGDWTEMARGYNELSGDEKFFDLLSETLDDPEAFDRISMFYLMMGLGFDGCHKNDLSYVERRMKLCATRFNALDNRLEEQLFKAVPPESERDGRKSRKMRICLAASVVFALLALCFNCNRFLAGTAPFRNAIDNVREKLARSCSLVVEAPNGSVEQRKGDTK
ncbi:MAG: DotU family type IV/VI secretion system protein [Victivallaceae bacterium]|nr:DotU family type IV/VI secretion system protein [Victivallaceae bacterium]